MRRAGVPTRSGSPSRRAKPRRFFLVPSGLLLALLSTACGRGSPSRPAEPPVASITGRLERDAVVPGRILVFAEVRDAAGTGRAGQSVSVTAPGAAVGATEDLGAGRYRVAVTPGAASGELPITAAVAGKHWTVTALVLPQVAAGWGQPESVRGLVNTPAYEDGIEIAPGGEWLFVNSYSPVDVLACLGCGADASCAACQTVIGPHAAPERPEMFGAWRIESPTRIANRCPKLCFTAPGGGDIPDVPLPPVAAFGFRRQADGSFSAPFVFGLDADGCNAPFGYALTGPPVGTSAVVVFAGTEPGSATGNDLFWAPLTLGTANVLASFACVGGVLNLLSSSVQRLALDPLAGTQGNPHLAGGWLFFDDEHTSTPPILLVTQPSGPLPGASFTTSAQVPLAAGEDVRQPHFDPPHLYFTRSFTIARARLADGGAPALLASWSAPETQLAAEPLNTARAGAIIVLGEPSVAHRPDGTSELYFVYGVRTGSGGVDLNAGRVVSAP